MTPVEHAITTTPADAARHLAWAVHDLSRQLVTVHTHHRIFPRALKNTYARYPWRGKTRQLTSNNASYQIQVLPTTTSTTATTHPPTTSSPRTA
ncbi:hypothetical protein [Lentzea sp. E54]|uniref:hypothetical protein n=1 Tax=Lentzea xerophila TaxID=3435883 RepID=UPI003DA4469E